MSTDAGKQLFLVSDRQKRVCLEPGTRLVVGRSAPADVVINGRDVSRRHAEVACDADGNVTVRDCGSTNGTRIGVRRIGVSPTLLRVGEHVSFGDADFVLRALSEASIVGDSAVREASRAAARAGLEVGDTGAAPDLELARPTLRQAPVAPETPSRVVRSVLAAAKRPSWTSVLLRRELTDMTLTSFMPLFQETTGMVEVRSEELSGVVIFDKGRFEDAETDDGRTGPAAFQALLGVSAGTFVLYASDGSADAARRLDALRQDRGWQDVAD